MHELGDMVQSVGMVRGNGLCLDECLWRMLVLEVGCKDYVHQREELIVCKVFFCISNVKILHMVYRENTVVHALVNAVVRELLEANHCLLMATA